VIGALQPLLFLYTVLAVAVVSAKAIVHDMVMQRTATTHRRNHFHRDILMLLHVQGLPAIVNSASDDKDARKILIRPLLSDKLTKM
jgi:hypothetical protein